jgi:hypothetical protein
VYLLQYVNINKNGKLLYIRFYLYINYSEKRYFNGGKWSKIDSYIIMIYEDFIFIKRLSIKMESKCVCGKSADKLCGKCEVKQYCSRRCQSKDWKSHKTHCNNSKNVESKCVCGKDADKLCSGCEVKQYCSRSCQSKDWKSHKMQCGNSEDVEKIMNGCFETINRNSMNLFEIAVKEGGRGAFICVFENIKEMILYKDTIPFTFLKLEELKQKDINLPSLKFLMETYDPERQVVTFLSCNGQNCRSYVVKKDVYKEHKGESGVLLEVCS